MWGNDFLAVTASHSFCLQKKKREKKKTSSKLFLKKRAFQEKTHRTLDRKPQKAMCCSTARHLAVTPETLLPEDRESGLYASAPLTAESEALGLSGWKAKDERLGPRSCLGQPWTPGCCGC